MTLCPHTKNSEPVIGLPCPPENTAHTRFRSTQRQFQLYSEPEQLSPRQLSASDYFFSSQQADAPGISVTAAEGERDPGPNKAKQHSHQCASHHSHLGKETCDCHYVEDWKHQMYADWAHNQSGARRDSFGFKSAGGSREGSVSREPSRERNGAKGEGGGSKEGMPSLRGLTSARRKSGNYEEARRMSLKRSMAE
ncbi:hypothetical protein BDY21DRAFT_348744 [Lineolata rhizophorae]|uniref:Uncharacterized protein n=1 Tax=Lineolata rhizophorae TaxID=578093 RepID=A0A6A6NVK4_9PEZI|nr:hypothetical protein BDY21DRAFT_348744 [Lineolata rhizophorae]